MSLVGQASNFKQYDSDSMDWEGEGSSESPPRRLIKRYLPLDKTEVNNTRVLDVGCGTGWFLQDCLSSGAEKAIGIEPSNLANIAKNLVPKATILQQTFEEFTSYLKFDLISFIMSTEHMISVEKTLAKSSILLSETGKIVIVAADFDMFQRERFDYELEKEIIYPNQEMAIRTKRPSGYGTTIDLVRSKDYWEQQIEKTGLKIVEESPVLIDEQYVKEVPKFNKFAGVPLLQTFKLANADSKALGGV